MIDLKAKWIDAFPFNSSGHETVKSSHSNDDWYRAKGGRRRLANQFHPYTYITLSHKKNDKALENVVSTASRHLITQRRGYTHAQLGRDSGNANAADGAGQCERVIYIYIYDASARNVN